MTLPPQEACYEKQMTMEEAQKMQQDAGMTCSEQTYAPDGKSGHSVCTMQGMTITSDFTVVGDFNTVLHDGDEDHDGPGPAGRPGRPVTSSVKMDRIGDAPPERP